MMDAELKPKGIPRVVKSALALAAIAITIGWFIAVVVFDCFFQVR